MREYMQTFSNVDINNMSFVVEDFGISPYCNARHRTTLDALPFNLIGYVVEGKGILVSPHGTAYLTTGDSYLIRANEPHGFYTDSDEPWTVIWIAFSGNTVASVISGNGLEKVSALPGINIYNYLKHIHDIVSTTDLNIEQNMERCRRHFVTMCQIIGGRLEATKKEWMHSRDISALKEYMDMHMEEHFSLEKCGEMVGLSVSQMSRRFRASYGTSPYEYLNQQRLKAAKIMLSNSRLSIQDISNLLGFEDQYYFSKYFKKKCGDAPNKYRDVLIQPNKVVKKYKQGKYGTTEKYAIGLDYGTLSVRALLVNIRTGEEVGVSVFDYPHGVMEKQLPTGEKLPASFALQHPKDYMDGLIYTVTELMEHSKVQPENVIGIGVDFTSSTVFPVYENGSPLCFSDEFKREPHAYAKLWKHHGADKEATYIDEIVRERGEEWISYCGGKISSEWMIPKVLETLHCAPEVYENADRYIEAMDWIVWRMTGSESRSLNGLRYKAFYNHKNGRPSNEFYKSLDPRMERFVEEKLEAPEGQVGGTIGILSETMAETLGLLPGTPIGTPIIDAHACVLGGGVTKPGQMMLIVGTSFCHYVFSKEEAEVTGVCSLVKDCVLPGYFAYEAGQSGGGDQFAWFINNCVPEQYVNEARRKGLTLHELLTEKLEGYEAGQSGLIALDWFNGVRSPLADFNLNGLIMGMNLQTKPEEIYLALIEATAYGTKLIVEEFEKAGIPVDTIVMSGGIPLKNPMLVQVFSDVLNREISVCPTAQSGALGAAMLGIAAASPEITGYNGLIDIADKLGKKDGKVYHSNAGNVENYNRLFEQYKILLEYFGKGANDVMKHLNKMRK